MRSLVRLDGERVRYFIYYASFFAVFGTAVYYFLDSANIISGVLSNAKIAGKQFTPVYYIFPMILVSMDYKNTKILFIAVICNLYMLQFVSFRQVYILTAASTIAYLFTISRRLSGKAISRVLHIFMYILFIFVLLSGTLSKDGLSKFLYSIADTMEAIGIPYHYQYQLAIKTASTLNGVYRSQGDYIYSLYYNNLFNFSRFSFPHGLGQKYSIGDPVIWLGNTLDNSIIFFNYHFSIYVMLILLASYLVFFVYNLFRQKFTNVSVFITCFLGFSLFVYFRAYVFLDISIAISFAFFLTAVAISGRSRTSGGPVRGSLR
tara:strand:+ start:152 stop:1108 length:957 start_codon:yes stop_codon:yes gene_type:complete